MSRQIAVAMAPEDEQAFLSFLREASGIAIYRSWSPQPEAVESLSAEVAASPFWFHSDAFPWRPQFEQVDYKDRSSGQPGRYFRLVTKNAPLLEYSRHPLQAENPTISGRLYWRRPAEASYDEAAFEAWFSAIARWIRKRARKQLHGSTEAWFLPSAQDALAHQAPRPMTPAISTAGMNSLRE